MTTLSNEERARIFMRYGFLNEDRPEDMADLEMMRGYFLRTILDAARPHINEEAFAFNDSELEDVTYDDLDNLTTGTLRILAAAVRKPTIIWSTNNEPPKVRDK